MKKGTMKSRIFKFCKFLILCMLLLIPILFFAGRLLILSEDPRYSDTIIVLSGGTGRVEKAVELYKIGFSDYLIFSNNKDSADISGTMLQRALDLGIPKEILLTEDEADSTYQNAERTLPIMRQYGFSSAIVVSSDFHMRRVKFIFDYVYRNSGIELTYIGSDSSYNEKAWWSDRYSRETTFNEYIKMIGNAFGYNGSEAKSALVQIKKWFQ